MPVRKFAPVISSYFPVQEIVVGGAAVWAALPWIEMSATSAAARSRTIAGLVEARRNGAEMLQGSLVFTLHRH